MQIKGKIMSFFRPRSGMFFSNFEFSMFSVKTEDGRFVFCIGETFPIFKGQNVILEGEFKTDTQGRTAFHFTSIEKDLSSNENLEDFLKLIIGPQTTKRLIAHFRSAENVIKIIKNNPSRLEEVKGIGRATSDRIVKTYHKNFIIEEFYKELKDLGFTLKDCSKILKKMGEDSIKKINKNPYILITKVGFSFKKCDEVAKKLNIPLDSDERNISGMFEVLKNEHYNGNTYVPEKNFFKKLMTLLSTEDFFPRLDNVKKSYDIALAKKWIYCVDGNIYTRKSWKEEEDIRYFVNYSMKTFFNSKVDLSDIREYEKMKGFSLGKEQVEAVLNSSKNKISIITGGPGTGKTTILDCLLTISKKHLSSDDIALCSPTGKAARRMSEVTKMPASTIHSLLKVDPTDSLLETFQYNENNKLPHKLIIVDEASMIDQFIAASLIRALRPNAQVVFVGDIEQLPPVGAGYFLRDLINAGVPCVKLKETYRQKGDSSIIKLSKQISEGKITRVSAARDFGFTRFKSTEQLVDMFLRGVKEVGLDEVVILTPQNKGELGVKAINLAIQNKLIPPKENQIEISKNGWIFRIGSKVMQTRNNNELGLVNGQTGYIKDIDFETKLVLIDFDGEEFLYDSDMLDSLSLAYAITVHKSQGSEWKYVIEIVSKLHTNNTKALIYTAITRAKEKLIIVGDLETFVNCPNKKEREILSKIL